MASTRIQPIPVFSVVPARRTLFAIAVILSMVVLAPATASADDALPLAGALDGFSNLISNAMNTRNLNRVAVLEFINETAQGESLSADFGLLGRYCAEKLEGDLMSARGDTSGFRVVDQRRMQAALRERQFTIDSLGSGEALKQLAESLDGLPVIVVGSITGRDGTQINLRCKLIETATGDVLGRWDMPAILNDSEWAMLGHSVGIRRNERDPADHGLVPSSDPKFFEVLDKKAQEAHPMIDPKFPYRVRMMIDGKERQGIFQGNEYFVPVRDGEVYELWIENKNNIKTLMRLLVDGLNTLSEHEPDQSGGKIKEVSAKRMSLTDARHWVLDPSRGQTVYAVRGFVATTGPRGTVDRFKVVAAENSLAARQQFTSDIGLITAAFYVPYDPVADLPQRGMTWGSSAFGSPRVGTGRGERISEKMETVDNTRPGRLICVLNIRYVSFDALPKADR